MNWIRHGRNSTFESVSHFCRIMRQDQSNVRQKCGSRFRRRISAELNSFNWIRHGRNATYEPGLRLPLVARAQIFLKNSLPRQNISRPSNHGSFCSLHSSSFNGNPLIGLAMLRNPRLRTTTNYVIIILLVTDLWCLGRVTSQKYKCN